MFPPPNKKDNPFSAQQWKVVPALDMVPIFYETLDDFAARANQPQLTSTLAAQPKNADAFTIAIDGATGFMLAVVVSSDRFIPPPPTASPEQRDESIAKLLFILAHEIYGYVPTNLKGELSSDPAKDDVRALQAGIDFMDRFLGSYETVLDGVVPEAQLNNIATAMRQIRTEEARELERRRAALKEE